MRPLCKPPSPPLSLMDTLMRPRAEQRVESVVVAGEGGVGVGSLQTSVAFIKSQDAPLTASDMIRLPADVYQLPSPNYLSSQPPLRLSTLSAKDQDGVDPHICPVVRLAMPYRLNDVLATHRYQIRVLGIPPHGARSRVEIQTKICLQLVTSLGNKVYHFSCLRLHKRIVTAERWRRYQQRHDVVPSDSYAIDDSKSLWLDAVVVCASDRSRRVEICAICLQREKRRAQRKKYPVTEELEVIESKILLVNTIPLINFTNGDALLPIRIPCYCRHHQEKLGFCILFTLTNAFGHIVAQGESPPILVTDDHKSAKCDSANKRENQDYLSFSDLTTSVNTTPTTNLSPTSPATSSTMTIEHYGDINDNMNRKRQRISSEFESKLTIDTSSMWNISSPSLTTTATTTTSSTIEDWWLSGALPVLSPTADLCPWSLASNFTKMDDNISSSHQLYLNSNDNQQLSTSSLQLQHRLPDFSNMMLPTVTTTSSASHTPLQSNILTHTTLPTQTVSLPQLMPVLTSPQPTVTSTRSTDLWLDLQTNRSQINYNNMSSGLPRIDRVVPAEGPMTGGIEVTIIGTGFTDMLTVQFGTIPTSSVVLWTPTAIVYILPPSQVTGAVKVTFKEMSGLVFGIDPTEKTSDVHFTYQDDSDRNVMELALTLIGLSMNGKVESPRSVASRIVSTYGGWTASSQMSSFTHGNGNESNHYQRHRLDVQNRPLLDHDALEVAILDSLTWMHKYINNGKHVRKVYETKNKTGSTILHLAVSARMNKLIEWLLQETDVYMSGSDENRWTPLHMACAHGWTDSVSLLLEYGADITLKTSQGFTPAQLALQFNMNDSFDLLTAQELQSPFDYNEETASFTGTSSTVSDTDTLQIFDEIDNGKPIHRPQRLWFHSLSTIYPDRIQRSWLYISLNNLMAHFQLPHLQLLFKPVPLFLQIFKFSNFPHLAQFTQLLQFIGISCLLQLPLFYHLSQLFQFIRAWPTSQTPLDPPNQPENNQHTSTHVSSSNCPLGISLKSSVRSGAHSTRSGGESHHAIHLPTLTKQSVDHHSTEPGPQVKVNACMEAITSHPLCYLVYHTIVLVLCTALFRSMMTSSTTSSLSKSLSKVNQPDHFTLVQNPRLSDLNDQRSRWTPADDGNSDDASLAEQDVWPVLSRKWYIYTS